jgi:hypothetical protein
LSKPLVSQTEELVKTRVIVPSGSESKEEPVVQQDQHHRWLISQMRTTQVSRYFINVRVSEVWKNKLYSSFTQVS